MDVAEAVDIDVDMDSVRTGQIQEVQRRAHGVHDAMTIDMPSVTALDVSGAAQTPFEAALFERSNGDEISGESERSYPQQICRILKRALSFIMTNQVYNKFCQPGLQEVS